AAGERFDFDGPRLRPLRARAARRRDPAARHTGGGVAAADGSRRAASATRARLVRADLQREADNLAVRRQRERLVFHACQHPVEGHDAHHRREQRRSGEALCADRGRRHRVAVRSSVPWLVRAVMEAGPTRGFRLLIVGLLLVVPAPASAEWQLRPFVGFAFGGATTFIGENEPVATDKHFLYGATAVAIGEVFGVEADLTFVPGFFTGGHLVSDSGV